MLLMLVLGFALAGNVGTVPICKETTCKCYEDGNVMVCPRGMQGNPRDCGKGFTLIYSDCVMAPIGQDPVLIPVPGPTQGSALVAPDFRPDLPGPGPDLPGHGPEPPANTPVPEPPANIPVGLDLPGPETLEIRSCETRKWTLRDLLTYLKQFDQDDINTILASITLAWALMQTVFFAICFRRKVSVHGLPPITRYNERLRLDSDRTDADQIPADDVTLADANGTVPKTAQPQAQEDDGDTLVTFAPLAAAKVPPKIPPRPRTAMRLLTTEEMRLQAFLERIGEGRYMQIVRSSRGRLTLAPAVYPQ